MGSGRGESGQAQEWADQSLASQGMRGGEQEVGGVERARRRGRASGERKRGAQTGSGWERTAWDCETARPTKAPVPVRLIVREGARVREGRGRLVHLRVRYDGEGVQPLALQTLPSRHIKALILKSKACGVL